MQSFHRILTIFLFSSLFFYSTIGASQQLTADTSTIAINKSANEQTLSQPDNQTADDSPKYKYYDVEVILFKHNNDTALQSEYWNSVKDLNTDDTQISSIDTASDIETDIKNEYKRILATFNIKKKHFIPSSRLITPLSSKQFILTKQAEHIKYSKNYRLLTHLAWRQAGLSKKDALPLRFVFDQQSNMLSGEIKIILSRFLHAEVNFNLIEEVCRTIERTPNEDKAEEKPDSVAIDKVKIEVQLDEQLNEQQKPEEKIIAEIKEDTFETICQDETIQFKQSRKMRSKQLHYLDHPVFGLLIQINPTKIKPSEIIQEQQIEQVKP